MTSLFSFLMYTILGKRWILWDMKAGYKMAIFVNEMEVKMEMDKMKKLEARKAELEEGYRELTESPLKNAVEFLSPDKQDDKKAIENMEFKLRKERESQLDNFRKLIKEVTQEVQMADGQLSRANGIAYGNRIKYDYIKNYKITKSYTDEGYTSEK